MRQTDTHERGLELAIMVELALVGTFRFMSSLRDSPPL